MVTLRNGRFEIAQRGNAQLLILRAVYGTSKMWTASSFSGDCVLGFMRLSKGQIGQRLPRFFSPVAPLVGCSAGMYSEGQCGYCLCRHLRFPRNGPKRTRTKRQRGVAPGWCQVTFAASPAHETACEKLATNRLIRPSKTVSRSSSLVIRRRVLAVAVNRLWEMFFTECAFRAKTRSGKWPARERRGPCDRGMEGHSGLPGGLSE
jgi:hypothetical protein